MTWLYLALLVLGATLLGVTAVRVLVGGLRPPHRARPDDTPAAPARPRAATSTAREILDERYAAGELSTEEYDHRRRVLER
ncbi:MULTISPECIES: SHOCT domain-containing protein [unclassified Isoptericola]|uniref:SHOCT domain-containing protein n=1 Tax=unclassified Isoptericola TaxID=2623355 RepID=UPI00271398B3|nr:MULTISPECIES: SHOCT domain-containing protein [unclassified Isoptericola]MDO8144889.1 SHOCT domain-containing protein [Isoptericola sp. 178]MDO8149668.1 SHOCT domain-containing protein [Isoptericola sp. b515]MDO8152603.1 SHOCT domain-containing protein [Isoptericola sp. b408]